MNIRYYIDPETGAAYLIFRNSLLFALTFIERNRPADTVLTWTTSGG